MGDLNDEERRELETLRLNNLDLREENMRLRDDMEHLIKVVHSIQREALM